MINKQHKALRLAQALKSQTTLIDYDRQDAAAELRRLHEVNKELVEALREILDEPKQTMSDAKALREIIRIVKATLAKAQGDNND